MCCARCEGVKGGLRGAGRQLERGCWAGEAGGPTPEFGWQHTGRPTSQATARLSYRWSTALAQGKKDEIEC